MDVEAFLRRARRQARDADRLAAELRVPDGDRVLNVHSYAFDAYAAFLRRYYSDEAPRIVALSMNPGPYGAVQTGIPFVDTPLARRLVPGFDRLVRRRPAWVASERVEMSGRKLKAWAEGRFGSLEAAYREILFPMTVPLAILRGPRRTNVPLPALPRSERDKIDGLLERHAAHEIRLARPRGVLLLGDYATHVWDVARRADADLARLPVARVPHPAAHITNASKYRAWTIGFARVARAGRIGSA